MLRCRKIVVHAGDYLARTLPWRVHVGFRVHLFMCRNCRRFVAQLGQTARLLGRSPPFAPAPKVEATIVEAFERHSAQHRTSHPD